MAQQHYRMTLEDAICQHKAGLISATALLYYYLKIKLAPGWKVTLHQRGIARTLGISKASFYKAIQRLGNKGLIHWETPNGLVVNLNEQPRRQIQHALDKSETTVDKSETFLDRSETFLDRSETAAKPKPPPAKNSDEATNCYQIFINSLSGLERENFEIFVRKQLSGLAKPIVNVHDYLASPDATGEPRYLNFYRQFSQTPSSREIRRRQIQLQLSEEVYQALEGELIEDGYDFIKLGNWAARDSPEWDLRLKFLERWEEKNPDYVVTDRESRYSMTDEKKAPNYAVSERRLPNRTHCDD